MASMKEIRNHMKSVEKTLKSTIAMYLISSANLRKARQQLNDVEPYFEKIESTISDILYHSPEIEHVFFDKRPEVPVEKRTTGFIVVTGDKGLAGAYNHNVIKLAEQKMKQCSNVKLFVVGQSGRTYFQEHGMEIDTEFLYTAQNPTVTRSRDIGELMLDRFLEGSLDEVYLIFTKMIDSFHMETLCHKLLPLDPKVFKKYREDTHYRQRVSYVPSTKAVMNRLVPGYVKGDIFGALVESYCSEQNSRMTAMKSSSDNARDMLQSLRLSYNRARQAAITQEITEVVGGAQAAQ